MIALTDRWGPILVTQPESGMGYQTATVVLRDGREFPNVMIVGGFITEVDGKKEVSFREEDIADIRVTHGRGP